MRPPPVLAFVPDAVPAPSTVVVASGSGSTNDVAEIEILVTDVAGVLAASFQVVYDSSIATYDRFDASASFLASDGAQLLEVAEETEPGTLTIGLTRASTGGVDSTGTQLLARLYFRRIANEGSGFLVFQNAALQDNGTPPQPIPGVQWFGGAFEIQ